MSDKYTIDIDYFNASLQFMNAKLSWKLFNVFSFADAFFIDCR